MGRESQEVHIEEGAQNDSEEMRRERLKLMDNKQRRATILESR